MLVALTFCIWYPSVVQTVRNVIIWVIFILIIIFYLPVTAAIQAVVNLDNVKRVPGLEIITRLPFVTQVGTRQATVHGNDRVLR